RVRAPVEPGGDEHRWPLRRTTHMSRQFTLPDLGEGLVEAEILNVLVREGDVVAEDAPLLEVETDKARVEIPSPIGGRVEKIHVAAGQTVKGGSVLVTFTHATRAARAAPPPSPRVTSARHAPPAPPPPQPAR